MMMYEWCNDLNELTGKEYQEIAQRLLSEDDFPRTELQERNLDFPFQGQAEARALVNSWNSFPKSKRKTKS